MKPYVSNVRTEENIPHYVIVINRLTEQYKGRRNLFGGKDPTTYFRELRDSLSGKRTF